MEPRSARWAGARRVAVGGMAEIWLATGAGGGKIAVKRLLPSLADQPEFVDAFVEEARLLELLDHPNILRVIELGMDEEPWIAVEWVDGVDLARTMKTLRARGEAAPAGLVALVARDLLAALAHVHGARGATGRPLGLVHRDVSPHNLLLGRDGACTLIDFGVAKCAELQAVTLSGAIKGKVAYLAPEQLEDRPLDGRVDQFGAAVVLYELACGRHPFLASCEGATMRAISRARPEPPAASRPDLPERFSSALLRALAAKPSDRFADVGAFAAELRAALPSPFEPAEVTALLERLFPGGLPHEVPGALVEVEWRRGQRTPSRAPAPGPPPATLPASKLGRLQLVRALVPVGVPGERAAGSSVELEAVDAADLRRPDERAVPPRAAPVAAPAVIPAAETSTPAPVASVPRATKSMPASAAAAPATKRPRSRPGGVRPRPELRPEHPPVLHPTPRPRDDPGPAQEGDGGAGVR